MAPLLEKLLKFLSNDASPRRHRNTSRLSGFSSADSHYISWHQGHNCPPGKERSVKFANKSHFSIFAGSKPVSHHNDYRPDPTGGLRGNAADRIRTDNGGLNGRNGSNNIQPQRSSSAAVQGNSTAASSSPAHSLQHHNNSSLMMPSARSIRGQIVVALYTYQGSEFGDMTFKKGDMMEIIDDT